MSWTMRRRRRLPQRQTHREIGLEDASHDIRGLNSVCGGKTRLASRFMELGGDGWEGN